MSWIDEVKWDAQGLVPVIAQDVHTREVLMLAHANLEAVTMTLETKRGTYYSRSRGKLWIKGEQSGNAQLVSAVTLDCDGDALLYSFAGADPSSYVYKLHAAGIDRVLKKIGEEAGEVIIAAKNSSQSELQLEAADLLFHTLIALAEIGVTPADLALELRGRIGQRRSD